MDTSHSQIINGRILYLCLKNFMCHDYFEINFNEKINFLSGPNGSGKSAIMAAIMLILGGKATHTSRASSVKEFIKEGKKSGEIVIHLKNDYIKGYRQDLYGKKIIIQKIFNINGSITHKIYSTNQKNVISTKSRDIQNICNQLNIQVSNPILMLTQDLSRTFFHNTNPKKLFEAVNQALKIDEIFEIYNTTQLSLLKVEENVQKQTKVLDTFKAELKLLAERLDKYEILKQLKNHIVVMEKEMHQFEYFQIITEMEQLKQTIVKEETILQAWRSKLIKFTKHADQNSLKIADLVKEITNLSVESDSMNKQHQAKFTESKNMKKLEKELNLKLNSISHQIKHLAEEKQTLQTTLVELSESNDYVAVNADTSKSKNLEKEKEKRDMIDMKKKEVQELKDKLESLRSMLRTQTLDQGNLETSIRHEAEKNQKYVSELTYMGEMLRKKRNEVRDISNSDTDITLLYGEWMPGLLKAIESAYAQKKFTKKPKGPIGLYINVKNGNASLAMETCLKRILRNFICDNQNDYYILKKLCEAHCPRHFLPVISIFSYSDKTYDISKYLCSYRNAYNFTDLIDIQDVDIFNYIMDQRKLESILFWGDTEDVAIVFSDDSKRPSKCSDAYAFNGDYYQYRDNNLSSYPCMFNRSKFLSSGGDKKEFSKVLNVEIGKIEEKMKSLHTEKGQININVQNFRGMKSKIDKAIDSLKRDIAILEKKNKAVTDQLNKSLGPDPLDEQSVNTLGPQELESLNTEIDNCDVALKNSIGQRDEITAELRESVAKYRQYTTDIDNLLKKAGEIRVEIQNIQKNVSSAQEKKRLFLQEIQKLNTSITEKEDIISSHEANLRQKDTIFKENFLQTHQEYIDSDDKTRVLRRSNVKKYKNKEEIIKDISDTELEIGRLEIEISSQNYDECKLNHENKKIILSQYETKFENFLKLSEKIQIELRKHVKGFDIFKARLNSRISGFFVQNMALRNFKARINIDTKAKEIIIHVKPDKTEEYCKDLKALSGGERSYTSICFLLALWNCLKTPFICIDEFDVFMDLVNREIGKELIIANAKATNSSQMIILTPLDIGNVEITTDISVWRLNPPERK
ncbi:unnamed protein product [Gordionus sp. m RMFG-2023]|uniref:structural maintenance of chromosomes protein 6-like n=1 Tax=Gordionus sp. m RMFG-2023 TaxID=3053472 RepID=UPI0030E0CC11